MSGSILDLVLVGVRQYIWRPQGISMSLAKMLCDICSRQHHPQRLPFLCPVDARNRLYEGRLAQAHLLMDSGKLENEVSALLSPPDAMSSAMSTRNQAPHLVRAEEWLSEQRQAVDRTNDIIAQADRLRLEIDAAKKDVERRKKAISRRKDDLASVSHGVAARRVDLQQSVERSIMVARTNWDQNHEGIATHRAFLCIEAARLYGLRRQKKGGSVRYEIGGVEIVDLHSMSSKCGRAGVGHDDDDDGVLDSLDSLVCMDDLLTKGVLLPMLVGASPEVISTSLAHMTHILVLASSYLAIRLPAEITLPHRDYPRPTIFSLASSYSQQPRDSSFGVLALHPQIPSESGDRERQQGLPRARPLYVDKSLSVLAKDSPSTYGLFIEGVALLAYDIAWACCTQGVPIGDRSSYEDVCNMGRNLYNLLIANQLHSGQAGRVFPVSSASPVPSDGENDKFGGATTAAAAHMMGRFSHGTAHSFLGNAEGAEFTRNFKLPNPIKLADRLKSKLSSDAPNPDWELLEDDAWTVT